MIRMKNYLLPTRMMDRNR